MNYLKSILMMTLILVLTTHAFAQRGQNRIAFQDRSACFEEND